MKPNPSESAAPDPTGGNVASPGLPGTGRVYFATSDPAFLDASSRSIARWLERTSQPFAATTLEGRIRFANRAFQELIGYSPAELCGATVHSITAPQWQADTQATLDRILQSGKSYQYEKEYRHRDGHLIPVVLTVDLDQDEQGRPCGYFAFVTDISERKRVEDALRRSEERFRKLFDGAPVGYHEIDAQGKIVNINLTECELLGLAREELIGRSFFDLIPEESRDEAKRAFQERLQGKNVERLLERPFLTHDGRSLIVSIKERPLYTEHGALSGFLGTVWDITEQKRTELALLASERRARALFEGIEDAIFVHSPEGSFLDVNPAATRLLGYSREELLKMKTSDIDAPDFAEGYHTRLEGQLLKGHLSFEGRHRAKSGRVVPVDINTSTILFDNRRAVLAVIRDITERKALEETRQRLEESRMETARQIEAKNLALVESEARYRLLTEGCLDAVVVADAKGVIILFNPAAEKIFGCPCKNVLGKPFSILTPEISAEMKFVLGSKEPSASIVGRTVETFGRRGSGEDFPLELSLSAIELAGELQFIGSIRDQTERQRMRAMLLQSEKLASIGLLSAGVAHEINNPLAYVANNLAVLERDLKGILELVATYEGAGESIKLSSPEVSSRIREVEEDLDWEYVRGNVERMLARTREGVQRVANIVQNLRGLARTSPAKLEPVSLPDLLESALEMIRGRLRRHNIEVVTEHVDTPRVTCVGAQISQVILNLLINAVQAVESASRPEGGSIRFTSRKEGDMIVFSICDNGSGIDPQSIPHLFDPFFTTKSVGEGTGLGLSISHGIVTGHGGRIQVESRLNAGSCFHVYLPIEPKA
ncbi:PAS domain-containing sensor histidine kinase [Singulisphaera sp. PoT]|uniref:PAS domain-containing sensor histidine kinase n=1 Tax=Singulisphaera sp. PoT TaxID=3411797 RepID=UPI003BF608DC